MASKQIIPDFPTTIAIFTGTNAVQLAQNPRIVTVGQLVLPFVTNFVFAQDEYPSRTRQILLVPKGTDVRGTTGGPTCDWIQIPALTGNWFLCYDVCSRWLGYPGEHILASVWTSHQVAPHDSPTPNPCTVPAIPSVFRTPFKN